MGIIFIHKIDTNKPAFLDQWVWEVLTEEKSAAKKVANKIKSTNFPLFAKYYNFLSTERWQSDYLNVVYNTLKFNFHIFPDKPDIYWKNCSC